MITHLRFSIIALLLFPASVTATVNVDHDALGTNYKKQVSEIIQFRSKLNAAITNSPTKLKTLGVLDEVADSIRSIEKIENLTSDVLSRPNHLVGMSIWATKNKNQCSESIKYSLGVSFIELNCDNSMFLSEFGLNSKHNDIFVLQQNNLRKEDRVINYRSGELEAIKTYLEKLYFLILSSRGTILVKSVRTTCATNSARCRHSVSF